MLLQCWVVGKEIKSSQADEMTLKIKQEVTQKGACELHVKSENDAQAK